MGIELKEYDRDRVAAAEAAALKKFEELKTYLADRDSVAVAFSGGVDSTFLLMAAREVLGDHLLAVTAVSGLLPEREFREAEDFCRRQGIRQIFYHCDPLQIEGFAANPGDRCYRCKRALFTGMMELAASEGMRWLAEGSNTDDMGDYRPGMRAVEELGVLSPLRACDLSKAEIRFLSRRLNLPTWNKQSFACLASRFAYGETITREGLRRVEQAEQVLLDLGFRQFRVRVHGEDLARIEVPADEISRAASKEVRSRIVSGLRSLGFHYVALDLQGYRTGSMNEVLGKEAPAGGDGSGK